MKLLSISDLKKLGTKPLVAPATTPETTPEQKPVRSQSTKLNIAKVARRANSEKHLDEILDWDLQPETAYHIISGGDIDSLTFLRHVLRNQPLDYCCLSSWCIAKQDITELERILQI